MDFVENRIINVKVDGFRVKKDSRIGGAQDEGNVTTMRFLLDPSWDDVSSVKVVFWNAKGENPTTVLLYEQIDGNLDNRVLECKIPFEAMKEVGEASYSLVGTWIDGDSVLKRQRTVDDSFVVLPAGETKDVSNASTPTAEEMEQVKAEMGKISKNVNELLSLNLKEVEGYAEAAHADMVAADSHRKSAQNDAVAARTARDAIYNMGVSAESVSPDLNASVTKGVGTDGSVFFTFKLPRGKSGVYVGDGAVPEGCNVRIRPNAGAEAILAVYDDNGNEVPIPAVKGADGLDPFSYAFVRGFLGTVSDFDKAYLGMANGIPTVVDDGIYRIIPGETWMEFINSKRNTMYENGERRFYESDGKVYGYMKTGTTITGGCLCSNLHNGNDSVPSSEVVCWNDWYVLSEV